MYIKRVSLLSTRRICSQHSMYRESIVSTPYVPEGVNGVYSSSRRVQRSISMYRGFIFSTLYVPGEYTIYYPCTRVYTASTRYVLLVYTFYILCTRRTYMKQYTYMCFSSIVEYIVRVHSQCIRRIQCPRSQDRICPISIGFRF